MSEKPRTGLTAEIQALLNRVDEDAKGTRCLTMAEVTLCLNALKALAASPATVAGAAPCSVCSGQPLLSVGKVFERKPGESDSGR